MKPLIVLFVFLSFAISCVFFMLPAGAEEDQLKMLMDAIEKKDLVKVKEMTSNIKDLNKLYISDTPLSLACKKSSKEIVRCLVDAGVNVNEKDGSFCAPIISAFENEDYKDIVIMLKDAGADISAENDDYRTPLKCALNKYITGDKDNAMELMKVLLENGAYIDPISEMGETPLMEACRMDDKELVRLFIKYGANVNFQNKDTMTPLKLSMSSEVAEMLKAKGAAE